MTDTDNSQVEETQPTLEESAELFYKEDAKQESTEEKVAPTETDTSDTEPEDEAEVTAEHTEESDESKDSKATKETEEPEYSDEELYVTINDEEVNLKQINDWRLSSLRQSDYTKKTQALADEKREFEADRDKAVSTAVNDKLESFETSILELDALIKEADESIDWDELREYDLGEYTRLKELKDKRVKAVADAKAKKLPAMTLKTISPEIVQREQAILIEKNPNWLDADGKQTEAHKKDLELLAGLLSENGFTSEDQDRIVSARDWQILLDAARYRKSVEKVAAVKKKVKKIPIVTKPKQNKVSKSKSAEEIFYPKSNTG